MIKYLYTTCVGRKHSLHPSFIQQNWFYVLNLKLSTQGSVREKQNIDKFWWIRIESNLGTSQRRIVSNILHRVMDWQILLQYCIAGVSRWSFIAAYTCLCHRATNFIVTEGRRGLHFLWDLISWHQTFSWEQSSEERMLQIFLGFSK